MRRIGTRTVLLVLCAAAASVLPAGCGGAKVSPHGAAGAVRLLMAVAPDSLDPAVGHTSEALESDWLVYTPLLTYAHSSGVPGTQVIPGLASTPPTITDGGRTYTFTLQPGLVYSSGEAVKASDFTWAVERAIRLHWSGAPQLITSRIVGASAFAAGRAKTISGISTDDSASQITIHLVAPWGPFDSVLALPVMAPVPRSTPMRNEAGSPPPGVGPYKLMAVVPGRSFSLVRNPLWRRGQLMGIPAGHVDVDVRITGDPRGNALAVLNNAADAFDSADRVPADLIPRILRQAGDRFKKQPANSTYLIFMNVKRKPFSNQLARIAVQTALDDGTLKQLSAGTLQEGCYLLPPNIYGHPHDQCPRGDIEKGGDVAAARALVARSGMAGARVTVWSPAGAPASSWTRYYTSLLDQIGFKVSLKLVPEAAYYATIGTLKLHPQTGVAELRAGLATPVDFYQRITGSAIRAQGNQNWGEISDPYLDHQVKILEAVPSTNAAAVSSFWHGLERYVANRAYLAVFGYKTAPQFVSNRLDASALHLSPVTGLDWTFLRLK